MATALTDAVRELELCSCAEVVIEIRSRSGSYAHADARFAALIAFVALVVLLFSPWPFRAGRTVAGSGLQLRRWTEYWTLIRTRTAADATKLACPNCGAPVAVGATGICTFCGGKITSGDFDWILSRIEQDESYSG